MTERLKALENELQKGSMMLAELDQRRAELRDTMLRISGAIQVLRELDGNPVSSRAASSRPGSARPGSSRRDAGEVLAMSGD